MVGTDAEWSLSMQVIAPMRGFVEVFEQGIGNGGSLMKNGKQKRTVQVQLRLLHNGRRATQQTGTALSGSLERKNKHNRPAPETVHLDGRHPSSRAWKPSQAPGLRAFSVSKRRVHAAR